MGLFDWIAGAWSTLVAVAGWGCIGSLGLALLTALWLRYAHTHAPLMSETETADEWRARREAWAHSQAAGAAAADEPPKAPTPARSLGRFACAEELLACAWTAPDPETAGTPESAASVARRLVRCRQNALETRRNRARLGFAPQMGTPFPAPVAAAPGDSGPAWTLAGLPPLETASAWMHPANCEQVVEVLRRARVPYDAPDTEALAFALRHDVKVFVRVF